MKIHAIQTGSVAVKQSQRDGSRGAGNGKGACINPRNIKIGEQ
jgi:hypothetical protein